MKLPRYIKILDNVIVKLCLLQSISSLPGVYRMGINTILEQLTELVPVGLTSILLFPVLDDASGAQKVLAMVEVSK